MIIPFIYHWCTIEYQISTINQPPGTIPNYNVIDRNAKSIIKQVTEIHEKVGLDLFLCQLLSQYIRVEALQEIQAMGIPVINISLDDMWLKNWTKVIIIWDSARG
ncbi:hypothetical protein ES708_26486 [subsurface metagenome]